MASLQQQRNQLLSFYQNAIQAVSGRMAVANYLQQHPLNQTCSLIAVGKAAAEMAAGAQSALGEQLRSGLVITKQAHTDPSLDGRRIQQIESSHPVPDERSLAAGAALLEFLADLPEDESLLFLLSGGASALVEVLPQGMAAEQLAELNRELLASGASISEMNARRKQLSQIKGGKLIPYLKGRRCVQLIISDVPGDELSVIGSAPLIGEAENIESHIIANNDLARAALKKVVEEQSLNCFDHPGHFEGETESLAEQFAQALVAGEPGVYLWGGESSLKLPAAHGRGGRNQHLALSAAKHLAGHDNILLLAIGTDGTDGPTEDAGGLVDGGTVQRGEWENFEVDISLRNADSGSFLEASADLVQTGPTGTNVMDLVIGWKW